MNIVHSPIQPFAQFVASRINKYGRMPLEQLVKNTESPIEVGDGEFVNWNDVCYGDQIFDHEAEAEAEAIHDFYVAYRMVEWFGPTPTESYREYLFNAVANLEARFYARCDATAHALDAWRKPYVEMVQKIQQLRLGDVQPCPIQRAERRMEYVASCRFNGTGIDWDEYSMI